jgi:hypothetical protein
VLFGPAAHYRIRPVTLPKGSNPYVTAVAPDGTLGGTFTDSHGAGEGFLLKGGKLRALPNLVNNGSSYGVPAPTSVLADGTAAGFADLAQGYEGFVWRNGAYTATFSAGGFGGTPNLAVNQSGTVVDDSYIGDGTYTVAVGIPPNFNNLSPPGSFPYGVSINRAGTVSGTFFTQATAVFLFSGGVYATVAYPGAAATYGGFLNDSGEVAGTYQDSNLKYHGYIERNGRYTSFDAHGEVNSMSVQALSNTGYVAGQYANFTRQHGFVYRHDALHVFAAWPNNDAVVVVGVSDAGMVAFDENAHAYTATCEGAQC